MVAEVPSDSFNSVNVAIFCLFNSAFTASWLKPMWYSSSMYRREQAELYHTSGSCTIHHTRVIWALLQQHQHAGKLVDWDNYYEKCGVIFARPLRKKKWWRP